MQTDVFVTAPFRKGVMKVISKSGSGTHTGVRFCSVVIDCKDLSMHTVDFYLIGSSCLFFRLYYY